jgi:FixJ family two-component response regulator
MTVQQTNVYVVDDDGSVREGAAALMRSAGLRVETFSSAQEALERARAKTPDCMVLDVHLPGISGLEFQEKLARERIYVPIIFLTGGGDIPMSVRAMRGGRP